ncbi:hypothetical protein Tco_1580930 [Tanacetum coccineum]
MAISLGKPILMDSMTAAMYHKGIKNISYARVLVEMDSEKELKNEIEIRYVDKYNYVKANKKVQVTYDWKPPIYVKENKENGGGPGGIRQDKNAEHENSRKEYRKKQAKTDANVKSKEDINEKSKWKVGKNVVHEIRKSANKYFVLDSLPEDNDQELSMLKERMIVDKYLNEKVQPVTSVTKSNLPHRTINPTFVV